MKKVGIFLGGFALGAYMAISSIITMAFADMCNKEAKKRVEQATESDDE